MNAAYARLLRVDLSVLVVEIVVITGTTCFDKLISAITTSHATVKRFRLRPDTSIALSLAGHMVCQYQIVGNLTCGMLLVCECMSEITYL
ncbi:hypothetical protein BADSM9389_32750 [Buttiauxella agrestis]|nr:hypothetical protein BADSM9389_32750 [Buttiauxella agrestis]